MGARLGLAIEGELGIVGGKEGAVTIARRDDRSGQARRQIRSRNREWIPSPWRSAPSTA